MYGLFLLQFLHLKGRGKKGVERNMDVVIFKLNALLFLGIECSGISICSK